MKRLLPSVPAILLLLLIPASSASAKTPVSLDPLRGPVVAPTTFDFSALPTMTDEYKGPPKVKVEGVFEEAEREVEQLKKNPNPPKLADLASVTFDTGDGGNSAFAPTIGNGFEGITQGSFIPLEPTVAAGPLNIFSAGNSSVTVTNKDGTLRIQTNGKTFFGVAASEGDISDAQCYYDAIHGRFVALCFTQGTSPTNYSTFYLAISQTNNARGLWYRYSYDMTLDGSTPTTNWGDYQALGISEDKLAFSSQQFSFAGNSYQYQKIRILDRAALYAGTPSAYVDFANFPAPPGGNISDNFVTKVGRNLTAGDNTIHCLCVRTGSGSRVTYRTVTGSPASPSLSTGNLVTVSAYSAPPDAEQMGTTALVPTNDCRPTDFYIRNGVLIATWHTAATFGGTVSAVRLFRMRTSDRAVLTDETYGAAGIYYYFPAVTVDSVGTIFLGFDRSSPTEFPSCYATGKRRGDASLQASALLKAGVSFTTQSRWGDYTGIDNDASLSGPGGSVAWYAGQWAKATTAGTWINRLTFTYGQISGTVIDDCDGNLATTTDRAGLAGATLTLMQGATTIATTTSSATGTYGFGYLESGTYDVVVTTPAGGTSLDAIAGTGGTSQTRISSTDVQVNLTNAQTSTANQFLIGTIHAVPVTTSINPTQKTVGDAQFTMAVFGTNLMPCSNVRLDGVSRATTYINSTRLNATIPVSDMTSPGTHAITVFTDVPGGGTSNAQTFTVVPDQTPPSVTVDGPNGGEMWKAGSTQGVGWTATDNQAVTTVDVDYSTDGGATFPGVIATGVANTGFTPWIVPNTPTTTARVRVRAHDAAGNVGEDVSDLDFTIDQWIITASAGSNGSITPSGAVGVAQGASQAFTITPSTGYHVADVLVDGSSIGAVTTHTFTNVTADHTIAASFAIDTHGLTTNVIGSGSVLRAPDQPSYDFGTSVTLTATPTAGWGFVGWSGDTATSVNPLKIFVTENTTVTATFADTSGPVVQVLGPNGGEVLSVGANAPLTWNATDNVGVTLVDLLLSRAGLGGPFDPIATGLANTGTYSWLVTGPPTTQALLQVVAHDAAGTVRGDVSDAVFSVAGATGVGDDGATAFALGPVRPHPIRGGGHVGFALPEEGEVRIAVLDVQGREVARIAEGVYPAGRHEVTWQSRDVERVGPGLYFLRLTTRGHTLVRRIVVTK